MHSHIYFNQIQIGGGEFIKKNFEVNNNSTEFSDLVLIPKVNHAIYTDCDAMRCGIINEQTLRDGLVDMGYYTMNLSKEEFARTDDLYHLSIAAVDVLKKF